MSVARLNFSHCSHEFVKEMVEKVRNLSSECGKPVGILLDCNGPKLRTEMLKNGAQKMKLTQGDAFTFYENEPKEEPTGNYVQAKGLCGNVLAGDKIYVDDGLLAFTVLRSNLESIECVVDNSGILGNRKGINLGTALPTNKPFLKRRDREDLELAKALDVEFVTVSCVRNAGDLEEIREVLYAEGNVINLGGRCSPQLLAKIENKSGLEAFEGILSRSDGIIIDRGYLGVEIDLASISTIQKLLVQGCTRKGKPVLIANHILESMKECPRPSRSEASDIASAVFLGGDGYILSSETAVGAYPVESLQWLRRICSEAETHLDHLDFQLRLLKAHPKPVPISESIASSTVKCAREVDASCIIVSTEGGGMARLIAKYRPSIPILAGCGDDRVAGQLAASFGIIPVVVKCSKPGQTCGDKTTKKNTSSSTTSVDSGDITPCDHNCQIDPSQVVYESLKQATALGLIEHGNRVVVASGQVDGFLDGSSTFMQVFTIGEDCYLLILSLLPWQPSATIMAICKFFQLGTCKKGSNCDFEHISNNGSGSKNIGIISSASRSRSISSKTSQYSRSLNFTLESADKFKGAPPSRRQSTRLTPSSEAHVSKKSSGVEGGSKKNRRRKNFDEKRVESSTEQHAYNNSNRNKKNRNNKPNNKAINNLNNSNYNKPNNNYNNNYSNINNINNNNSNNNNILNTDIPSLKDYVDMVMNDLSTRPPLWYFSSYGLSLSPTASLPFPYFGGRELSVEELRLQVYAEASATGGRIDNYIHVVEEIKTRAETTTKMLIPDLARAVEETLKSNGIPYREAVKDGAGLRSKQDALKQILLQQSSTSNRNNYNPPNTSHHDNLLDNPNNPSYQALLQYQSQSSQSELNNMIIPDDAFTFGCIPEMAPE